MRIDKRIQPVERNERGACGECMRRHIHKDDCSVLLQRVEHNDGTDPDKAPIPYAGGLLS